ncbi:MAG: type II toxin-antitoxin system death-on-curing family toxin [Sedimentisphaerales bacterium]|nr:type II toxin-antitoxin system death-on-curing family toxin [Sedimentisphaerales bacterium]
MRAAVIFLSGGHVRAIHARVITEFGGDPHVRDEGLLASAVAMPTAQFEGEYLHKNLAEMAGAYLYHLCRNHPFVDGNKRTALAAADIFLRLNNARLNATNRQLEKTTLGVADGGISKRQLLDMFADWVTS